MDDKNDRHAAHSESSSRHARASTYVVVWIGLLVLTAVTVWSASIRLGGLTIVVCLSIAAFKSILVLLWFMHLRHEKSVLIRILIPIVIAVLAIFIGLTYSDIILR